VSAADVLSLLDTAARLKTETRAGHLRPLLAGKTVALLFQKPSLRTRVSFDVGMAQFGGRAIYLSPDEVQLGKREPACDVARVLSRYVDAIVARVFSHDDIEELARYATVPVINGLSDRCHPCQALADFLTIREHFGAERGVRVAYIGDGNNVANSLLLAGAKLGTHIAIASPRNYECREDVVALARRDAAASGAEIRLLRDPVEAVRGAQVVYTDTWVSMGQEAEARQRLPVFRGYQVNSDLLALAAPDVAIMHDLPAYRGREITPEAMEDPRSIIFDQAENRLHAQKAVLVWAFGQDPYRER
jgi:ornithine carbamoyltransferase